jgi:hypothetical protein
MPLPAGGDANDARPEGSVSQKHFSFNFGDDVATLPKSTTTSVIVTGNDASGNLDPKSPNLTGKVKINWHSPWGDGVDWGNMLQPRVSGAPGTKIDVPPYKDGNGNWVNPSQKDIQDINPGDTIFLPGDTSDPLTVTGKRTNPDGTTTLDYVFQPPSAPDEQDDIDEQIAELQAVYPKIQHVGASLVKLGLEAYKDVAMFYATAPFYEAAAGTLISAASKASELLAQANQARAAAQNARAVAANATEIANEARAAIEAGGKSADEIASLQQKAAQMDKLAGEANSQAGALDEAANKYGAVGQDTLDGLEEVGITDKNYELPPDIPSGAPGSAEHKAAAWADYQARPDTAGWDYDRWSKVYDLNVVRATQANAAADAYGATLGWGLPRQFVEADGVPRVLDWADKGERIGIEYKTGYASRTAHIREELRKDAWLVANGWEISWVFEGTASQPLIDELTSAGIGVIFR